MPPCDDEPWDPIGRGRGHEDSLERKARKRKAICADTHKADQSIRFSLGRSIRWAAYGPLDGLRERSVAGDFSPVSNNRSYRCHTPTWAVNIT